jgi:hypothetical protein
VAAATAIALINAALVGASAVLMIGLSLFAISTR